MVVRAAAAEDALQIAEVHVRSWQAGYRGLLPGEYLDGLLPADRAARYRFGEPGDDVPLTLVAVDAERICGFVACGRSRDADAPGLGEVMALYVDPGRWRAGIASRLMARAQAQLKEMGHTQALLWMLKGNERAAAFYAAGGWVPDGSVRREQIWGVEVRELRYRRQLP